MGPVTSEENCACNPLSLTLSYNTDFSLKNIISVAPLQKYGHEPLTEDEHKKMVSIAQSPSPELLSLQAPQDMIDGSTGATSLMYKDKVVDKAGYSSWRISRLASETAQILQGAPIQRDMDRLQKKMQGAETPAIQRERLIEFIPTAESDYLKQRALFILAELYLKGLSIGEKTDSNIESIILNTGLGSIQEAELLINLCLAFVEQKVASEFVSQCVQRLEQNEKKTMFAPQIALLKGMELFEQGKGKEALPFLEKGLASGDTAPELRQKMAIVYKELKETKKACTQLEGIYLEAPRWPNLETMMSDCGNTKSLLKKLDTKRKKKILSTQLKTPKKVSSIDLKDESGSLQKIDFSAKGKKTVVVFFATWCPHCQKEMPRLVEFYNELQSSAYKDQVELLAVRASTARETQSFAEFKKQYNIPFTIMTDEGIAFESFASEQGVSPGFPMMAVTNAKGEVSYFLSHGDHNDTAKELFWILESL
jgi:thiol-disulfide isomerase/thioredoxin